MTLDSLGLLADPTAPRSPVDTSSLDSETAVSLLQSMCRIRAAEVLIGDLVESGEATCPCHLAIGQEAAAVGVAQAMTPADVAFGAHRSHSHYLALGASVDELIAEVLGKSTGCSGGFGGSMHLTSPDHGLIGTVPIVGATIPLAVGAAWAAKRNSTGGIAVAFFGDGATEEGVFHESANLASAMAAPVVFVCENNLFSSHLAIRHRQPTDTVGRYGKVHGLEVRTVDGNDVVAVSAAMHELAALARSGQPGMLEAVTFRWRGHVGHREDIDVGVGRSSEEVDAWKKRDCIARLSTACVDAGLIAPDVIATLEQAAKLEVEQALDAARNAPYPTPDTMHEIVYHRTGAGA